MLGHTVSTSPGDPGDTENFKKGNDKLERVGRNINHIKAGEIPALNIPCWASIFSGVEENTWGVETLMKWVCP